MIGDEAYNLGAIKVAKVNFTIIAFCVIIVAFLVVTQAYVSAMEIQPRGVNVQRTVYITDWGVTVVNDTITLTDTHEAGSTRFRLGVPAEFASFLRYAQAKDESGSPLPTTRILDSTSGVLWVEFKLEKEVGETHRFNVATVYSDLVSYQMGRFSFNFTETPLLDEKAELCNVTVVLPRDSTVNIPENYSFAKTSFNGLPALNAVFKPLQPFTWKPLNFTFQSITVQLFKVHWAERKVTFKPLGGISVEDSYSVTNLSTSTSQIEILLPKNSSNVMAYDKLGPIWDEPQKGDRVTVSPRYGTIKANESFTFTLKYDLSNSHLSRRGTLGQYELNLTLITPQPFIIYHLTTEITFPKSLSVNEVSKPPDTLSDKLYEVRYLYDVGDVTPLDDLSLQVGFKYDGFWAAVRPIGIVAMVEAAFCALYASLKTVKREVVEEGVTVPADQIRRVTELIDEKIGLRNTLEDLDEKLAKKAISKNDYRRRRRGVETRLAAINRLLKPLKSSLASLNPRYGEILNLMDKAEAEVEAVYTSIRNLRVQYRIGKIEKTAYLSIHEELRSRLEKAKSKLESLNVSLKEEAG